MNDAIVSKLMAVKLAHCLWCLLWFMWWRSLLWWIKIRFLQGFLNGSVMRAVWGS